MARDELLEQIRQPLWDRIDRRMAAILAISIGAHLAIAIVSWLGDPPIDSWLPGDEPQPAFTADTLEVLQLPDPTDGAAGVAAAVAPAPAAPKSAPAPARPRRTHGAKEPARIDPRALVNDLVGDGPSFQEASRRVGRGLEDQLNDATQAHAKARVGKDGGPETHSIGDGEDPPVGDVDGPVATKKAREFSPPRYEPEPPPPGVPYDPSGDMPTVALRRCMESTGDLAEGETAKLRLVFTIGKDGHVTKADVDGPADHHRLAACVEKRLAAWTFPVELPAPAMFRMSMMCIAR